MKLVNLALFVLILLVHLVTSAAESEDYENSPARFFLSRTMYMSGYLLDEFDLLPLEAEKETLIIRCTVQTGSSNLFCLTLRIRNEVIESEIRSKKEGQVNVRTERAIANSPRYGNIIEIINIFERPKFFAPLTHDEDQFFEMISGGVWVLFEVESPDYSGKISILDPGDIRFQTSDATIRDLTEYSRLLGDLFKLWDIDVNLGKQNLEKVPADPFK